MANQNLSIVAISSLNGVHQYVLQELAAKWPFQTVIRPDSTSPVATPRNESRWSKLRKRPLKLLANKINHTLMSPVYRRRDRAFYRALFGQNAPPATHLPTWDVPAAQLNERTTEDRIASLKPDVLIACGAPLLKPNIFEIPRLGALNIHYGISPQYRGEHTLFWPLMRGEDECLGVTIHRIDSGVDSGPVFCYGFPELATRDTEEDLWVKCAKLSVRLLDGILTAFCEGPLQGRPQAPADGRNIRFRDRKILHQVRYWIRQSVLRMYPKPRPERIERFY